MLGKAHQIDRDIDVHVRDELRHLGVAVGSHVEEVVERAGNARMHLAVRRAEADAGGFEPGLVVALEHARDKPRHRVVIEVRGQIGDADTIMGRRGPAPYGLLMRVLFRNEAPGDRLHVGRITEKRETGERRKVNLASFQIGLKFSQFIVARCPIATALQAKEQGAARVFVSCVLFQNVPVAGSRVFGTPQRKKSVGTAEERFRMVRPKEKGPVIVRNRLQRIEVGNRIAAMLPRLGRSGVEADRLVEIGERSFEKPLNEEHQSAVPPGFGVIGPERERLVEPFERLIEAAELGRGAASVVPRLRQCRRTHQHGIEVRFRFRIALKLHQRAAAIGERLDIVGLHRNGFAEAADGIFGSLKLQQQAGAIVDRIGARLDRDRGADQALGFVDLARLVTKDAERMQRLEMFGIGTQDLAVNLRSLGQAARAAQTKGVVERGIIHGRCQRAYPAAGSPLALTRTLVASSRARCRRRDACGARCRSGGLGRRLGRARDHARSNGHGRTAQLELRHAPVLGAIRKVEIGMCGVAELADIDAAVEIPIHEWRGLRRIASQARGVLGTDLPKD